MKPLGNVCTPVQVGAAEIRASGREIETSPSFIYFSLKSHCCLGGTLSLQNGGGDGGWG